ncbi:MAG: peptide-methionine (R)-S-oxide reductase MsrB [Candidatus Eisenbacteria bacterium]
MADKIVRTDDEWKKLLTEDQYRVLREKGTESPNSGKYYQFSRPGVFLCSACGNKLFSSEAKFESGTGWPSFWGAVSRDSLETAPDHSSGRERTEVLCARCGGHLGHVFADGPVPTGMRYCINSVSLEFKEEE